MEGGGGMSKRGEVVDWLLCREIDGILEATFLIGDIGVLVRA